MLGIRISEKKHPPALAEGEEARRRKLQKGQVKWRRLIIRPTQRTNARWCGLEGTNIASKCGSGRKGESNYPTHIGGGGTRIDALGSARSETQKERKIVPGGLDLRNTRLLNHENWGR